MNRVYFDIGVFTYWSDEALESKRLVSKGGVLVSDDEALAGVRDGSEQIDSGLVDMLRNLSEEGYDLNICDTRPVSEIKDMIVELGIGSFFHQIISAATAEPLAKSLQTAMKVDPQAFADAIQMNMDQDDMTQMITQMMTKGQASYEDNLKNFGYADLKKPSMIMIYPKDFDSKEKVTNIIDGYNDRMKKTGQDDKVITYSDIVGTLMSSVTDIINQLSMILIAFVAISLVVSSIMIGVITYISVLERKKEIGILRAMGASKGNVANVFNAETFIIGALAGLLGIGIQKQQ